jgi:hypothetical protein
VSTPLHSRYVLSGVPSGRVAALYKVLFSSRIHGHRHI